MSENLKPQVKNIDMSKDAEDFCMQVAQTALDTLSQEKDIAHFIKKEFEGKFGPTWHCVIGKRYGSYVTHETKHYIYFYVGPLAVLLWKC